MVNDTKTKHVSPVPKLELDPVLKKRVLSLFRYLDRLYVLRKSKDMTYAFAQIKKSDCEQIVYAGLDSEDKVGKRIRSIVLSVIKAYESYTKYKIMVSCLEAGVINKEPTLLEDVLTEASAEYYFPIDTIDKYREDIISISRETRKVSLVKAMQHFYLKERETVTHYAQHAVLDSIVMAEIAICADQGDFISLLTKLTDYYPHRFTYNVKVIQLVNDLLVILKKKPMQSLMCYSRGVNTSPKQEVFALLAAAVLVLQDKKVLENVLNPV